MKGFIKYHRLGLLSTNLHLYFWKTKKCKYTKLISFLCIFLHSPYLQVFSCARKISVGSSNRVLLRIWWNDCQNLIIQLSNKELSLHLMILNCITISISRLRYNDSYTLEIILFSNSEEDRQIILNSWIVLHAIELCSWVSIRWYIGVYMKNECEFKITWAKESILKSYAIGNTKPINS